ncbi:MAG: PRC-barrel domain-containing protein [Actinobacteria bacterium]|nr:PRC-barrel domain-containing protein [Actinomycetota bacterium]
MARTDSDFLGLEVISLEDSTVVGEVDGLLVDERRNAIAGLALDAGIYEANAVAYADLRSVEDDAIFVDSSAVVHPLSQHPLLAAIAERDIRVVGEVVLDDRGDVVGVVQAFSVDPASGALVSLEVAPEDARSANGCMIPMDEVIRIGGELIVVRSTRPAEEAGV